MTLAEIRNPDCTLCPLHANATNVCVMGSGPLDARVFLIGQAPGYNEDQRGIPFIGKAGQLLDEELERIGIPRESVYVTNTAKCYPPGDRQPTRAEMKACRPYLDAELALVKPELVITLGNTAMQGILGVSGITTKANAIYEKNGLTVIPVVHPAYVLRDPTHTDSLRTGLGVAKRFLEGTAHEELKTTINLIQTPADIEQFLGELNDEAEVVAFDIETATIGAHGAQGDEPAVKSRPMGGLQPWAPDWRLDTVAFSWQPEVAWVLPVEHPETPETIRRAMNPVMWADPRNTVYDLWKILSLKKLGGHNVKFDLQGLRVRGSGPLRAFFDTVVMAHLLNENHLSKSLGALATQYLGAGAYKDDVKKDGTDPLDKLALYNGRDADYTLRLYHIFREQLLQPANKRLRRIYTHISMPAQNALVDVELRGFPIRVRRLRDRHVLLKKQIVALEEQMLAYVPAEAQGRAKWGRSNFLLQFMFETLGLPIVKFTAKGEEKVADSDERWKGASVDEESLLQLIDEHPMVGLLMERTGWAKLESTYTRNWIKALLLTRVPRVYPNYNVTGTVTGRLSSNMQQVPRDNFIRGIITAPRGYMLIEADFSQIELRIAAMVSHDPAMMAVYQRGEDLHMLMASAITGKPASHVTKEERSRAKPVSFGFLYSMGWKNFIPYARAQFGITVTPAQAQHYRNSFFLQFPRLKTWHDSQRRQVHVLGYVESPIGRKRRLPAINSPDEKMREDAGRQAINSPVQGFASDLTLLAMIEIEHGMHDGLFEPGKMQMIGQVHDSILLEVKEDCADEYASYVKTLMESLHRNVVDLFGYTLPVPLVADVSVVKYWGGE